MGKVWLRAAVSLEQQIEGCLPGVLWEGPAASRGCHFEDEVAGFHGSRYAASSSAAAGLRSADKWGSLFSALFIYFVFDEEFGVPSSVAGDLGAS